MTHFLYYLILFDNDMTRATTAVVGVGGDDGDGKCAQVYR